MKQIELRVKRLEANISISERRMKIGEFGYATLSEIREMLAAIDANWQPFVNSKDGTERITAPTS